MVFTKKLLLLSCAAIGFSILHQLPTQAFDRNDEESVEGGGKRSRPNGEIDHSEGVTIQGHVFEKGIPSTYFEEFRKHPGLQNPQLDREFCQEGINHVFPLLKLPEDITFDTVSALVEIGEFCLKSDRLDAADRHFYVACMYRGGLNHTPDPAWERKMKHLFDELNMRKLSQQFQGVTFSIVYDEKDSTNP